MATSFERLTIGLDPREAREVEELAGRLSIPDAAAGRLLVKLALATLTRDPGAILGLPPGAQTRSV